MTTRHCLLKYVGIFGFGGLCGAFLIALLVPQNAARHESRSRRPSAVSILHNEREEPDTNRSSQSTARDFQRELAEIARLPESPDTERKLKALVAEWVPERASEAFEVFLRYPGKKYRSQLLEWAVRVWVTVDPEATLAAIESVADVTTRQNLVVVALSRSNPEECLDRLEAMNGKARPELYARLFGTWMREDPAAAMERLASVTNALLRSPAVQAVVETLAMSDPSAAFEWAASLEDSKERSDALVRAMELTAQRDPAAALEKLELLTSVSKRHQALSAIVKGWTAYEPGAALDWIHANTEGNIQDSLLSEVLQRLVQSDLQAGAALLAEIPAGHYRRGSLGSVARAWTLTDSRVALEWAQSLPAEETRHAIGDLVRSWFQVDPAETVALAKSLPNDTPHDYFRRSVVRSWVEADPESAVSWARSLDDGGGQKAYEGALRAWVEIDPQSAAPLVAGLEDAGARNQIDTRIALNWFSEDPAAGAEWVMDRVGPPLAPSVFHRLAEKWSAWDPLAASEWIATMESGPAREAAVLALVENIMTADPDGAAAWLETIPGSDRRDSLTAQVESWRERNQR